MVNEYAQLLGTPIPSTVICCKCRDDFEPICPQVIIETKSSVGEAERPQKCGNYDYETGKYYMVKTETITASVKAISSPCPPRSCEMSYCEGLRWITTEDQHDNYTYVHKKIHNYELHPDGSCSPMTYTEIPDSYEMRFRRSTEYSNSMCSTLHPIPRCYASCHLDEVTFNSITTFDEEWKWEEEKDLKTTAYENMENNWTDTWVQFPEAMCFSYLEVHDEEEIVYAAVRGIKSRFLIIGGNTGYIKFTWKVYAISSEDPPGGGRVVRSGEIEKYWDPWEDEDEFTIPGPDVDPPEWPDITSTANSIQYLLGVYDLICVPENDNDDDDE